MNRLRFQSILIIGALIGIFTFFFQKTKLADPSQNNQVVSAIQQLILQDTLLNQSTLQTRTGNLTHYDTFVEEKLKIALLIEWLREVSADFEEDFEDSMVQSINEIQGLLQKKMKIIEHFKSRNAILKNSLNYLPLAVEQHIREFPEDGFHDELDALLLEVLLYNSRPDDNIRQKVFGFIHDIDGRGGEVHKLLLRHAETIITLRHEVLLLVDEVLNLPTRETVIDFHGEYSRYYDRQLARAGTYRTAMYIMAILLVFYVLLLFLSLRDSTKKLKASLHELHFQKYAIDQHAILAITDAEGVITYVNDKFCEISKYSREELIGKTHRVIFSGHHSREFFTNMWTCISSGNVWKGEIRNRRKDGTLYWVNTTIVPFLDDSGNPERYIAIRADITERKQAEEEVTSYRDHLVEIVKERTRELEEAKRCAEVANIAKSQFLANMSHELRTPLNSILGFLGISLGTKGLPVNTVKHLKTAKSSAENLLCLLNDILDISKLEEGRMELENIPFDLHAFMKETQAALAPLANGKGLPLTLKIRSDVPVQVVGDPTRLRQILLNLIGNSIKFTEKGLINVVVGKAEEKEGYLAFSVLDTGIGITDEQKEIIFDSFMQADASIVRKYGGTGLGTSISKQLVEMMEGWIWIDSTLGNGTTFHFVVKLPGLVSEAMEEPESFDRSLPWKSTRPLSILLVEDVEANEILMIDCLEEDEHKISVARNGVEAVESFKENHEGIDIILMDVQMPRMNGYEATKAIRLLERQVGGHVPIIALTAGAMKNEKGQCLDAGMDAFVSKPIDFEKLNEVMAQFFLDAFSQAGKTPPAKSRTHRDIPMQMPGIDLEKALQSWKDEEKYLKMLYRFSINYAGASEEVRYLIEKNDQKSLQGHLHILKGLAGNLSMPRLYGVMTRFEEAIDDGGAKGYELLVDELEQCLKEVFESARLLNRDTSSGSGQNAAYDSSRVAELLSALYSDLDKDNPDPLEPLLEELGNYLKPEQVLPINKLVDEFDFREAEKAIQTLANTLGIELQ